jgi:hypothetical protein
VRNNGLNTRNKLIDGPILLTRNSPKGPVVVTVEGQTDSFVELRGGHVMRVRDIGDAHPRPHLFGRAMHADGMTDGVQRQQARNANRERECDYQPGCAAFIPRR